MCCPWSSLGVPLVPTEAVLVGPSPASITARHRDATAGQRRRPRVTGSAGPCRPFHTQLALQPVQPRSASACSLKRLPQKAAPWAAVGARSGPSRFPGPPGFLHHAAPAPRVTGQSVRDRGSRDPPLTAVPFCALCLCVSASSPSGSRLREV